MFYFPIAQEPCYCNEGLKSTQLHFGLCLERNLEEQHRKQSVCLESDWVFEHLVYLYSCLSLFLVCR